MKDLFFKSFSPMLLSEISKPFTSKDYLYELKYDGIRALLFVSTDSFKIMSRNKQDITFLFPELKEIQKLVSDKVIFDGEIVSFKDGKPSFLELQKRLHIKKISKIHDMALSCPIVFVCFDILYEKKSLLNKSLIERKKVLDKYKNTSFFFKTSVFHDGIKLFQKVKKLGLEGIVAKKKDSFYEINERTSYWMKIKNLQREEFYILGYSYKESTPFVSLYLGEEKEKNFYFVGKVSVSKKKILDILNKMNKRKKSCFQDFYDSEVIYLPPKYQCNIEFLERSPNGKLRHPVFLNLVNFD